VPEKSSIRDGGLHLVGRREMGFGSISSKVLDYCSKQNSSAMSALDTGHGCDF
jgi:hypothetical protein